MVEEGCFDSLKSGILVDLEGRNVVLDEGRENWLISVVICE